MKKYINGAGVMAWQWHGVINNISSIISAAAAGVSSMAAQ